MHDVSQAAATGSPCVDLKVNGLPPEDHHLVDSCRVKINMHVPPPRLASSTAILLVMAPLVVVLASHITPRGV